MSIINNQPTVWLDSSTGFASILTCQFKEMKAITNGQQCIQEVSPSSVSSPSSLTNSFLQLLHTDTVCGGYFAMSAQRVEEEDGAVGCSETIRNLTALKSWVATKGWEFFFNMANWPPDYRRDHWAWTSRFLMSFSLLRLLSGPFSQACLSRPLRPDFEWKIPDRGRDEHIGPCLGSQAVL